MTSVSPRGPSSWTGSCVGSKHQDRAICPLHRRPSGFGQRGRRHGVGLRIDRQNLIIIDDDDVAGQIWVAEEVNPAIGRALGQIDRDGLGDLERRGIDQRDRASGLVQHNGTIAMRSCPNEVTRFGDVDARGHLAGSPVDLKNLPIDSVFDPGRWIGERDAS